VPERITEPWDPRLRDYVRLTDIVPLAQRGRARLVPRRGGAGAPPRWPRDTALRSVVLADNRWDLLEPGLRTRLEADGAPVYAGEPSVLEQVTPDQIMSPVL